MAESDPVIRNISDTARWAAAYRARETKRSDALFRDPLAERLAGDRGQLIADRAKFATKHTWSWIARTWLVDELVTAELRRGADMVINLAAGLDARPYRMEVAPNVQWIEADLPEITAYKEEVLAGETPRCELRRVKLDLANRNARQALFSALGARAKRAVVITEGLLIYLTPYEAGELAEDLGQQKSFRRWILDIASPGLMKMMQKKMGADLDRANAPFKFAPAEGPAFFEKHGWRAAEVHPLLHTAAKLKRLPLFMRLVAMFPSPANGVAGNRPWSGVVVLENAVSAA